MPNPDYFFPDGSPIPKRKTDGKPCHLCKRRGRPCHYHRAEDDEDA